MIKIYKIIIPLLTMLVHAPHSDVIRQEAAQKVRKHLLKQNPKPTDPTVLWSAVTKYVRDLALGKKPSSNTDQVRKQEDWVLLIESERRPEMTRVSHLFDKIDWKLTRNENMRYTISTKSGFNFDILEKLDKSVKGIFLECLQDAIRKGDCFYLNDIDRCSFHEIRRLEEAMRRIDPNFKFNVEVKYKSDTKYISPKSGRKKRALHKFSEPIDGLLRYMRDTVQKETLRLRQIKISLPEAFGSVRISFYKEKLN